MAEIDVNNYKDNPHLLQHSSGRIFLHFDYMSDYQNGTEINNIYSMYSDDNGATWSEPVAVTSHETVGSRARNPAAVEQSDGDIFLAIQEENAAMYFNETLDGFPSDDHTFYGSFLQYDETTKTLIHMDKSGVLVNFNNITQIDCSDNSYQTYWDEDTSPATLPTPYMMIGSQHPYYIFVDASPGNRVMILNVETDTWTKYVPTCALEKTYTPDDANLIVGHCNWADLYSQMFAFVRTVGGEDRLYIAMADTYSQQNFIFGYIDLAEIADPITGFYTWNEVHYSQGLQLEWVPNHGYGGAALHDFFWIPEISRYCVVSYSGNNYRNYADLGIALFNEEGTVQNVYVYNSNPGMPHGGCKEALYLNGSIWFTFDYDTNYPDRRGLGRINLANDTISYHEANWFSCDTGNCGFGDLTDMGDGERILLHSNKSGCDKGGVVIFDTVSYEWTVFNNTTLPGLISNCTATCNQWGARGYRRYALGYDSVTKTIYACYFKDYNTDCSHGVIAFSEYGAYSTIKYAVMATPDGIPEYGSFSDLSYYDFEYNPALAVDASGYVWVTWDHMDSLTENDLMWSNTMSDLEIQSMFVADSSLVIEWDVQKINRLSFTLSHGHLLDPLNFSSTWSVYLKMGRLLTLEIGENVSDTDYYQGQGEFVVKETSLTYNKDYPKITVVAEDLRTLFEDAQIVASEYFSGSTPKTVIENLLSDHGGLAGGDYDIPTFSGTHDLYHQFLDMTLEEAVQSVLDHFGYFPFVNVDGKFEPRHIDLTDSVDHTYTGTEIIEYTPDSAYATFVNRVVVTGMSNVFTEVLYEEESIKNISGTIGWWGSDEDITIYYSQDRQRRCRYPRLEIIQSVSEFEVWGIKGGGGEEISSTDEDEYYLIISIDAPNLVGALIAGIAALIATAAACTYCDGVITGWCGICIFAVTTLLNVVLYILGAVASYSYNIWARPIGHERVTFQAQADDEEFQQQINEKIVAETIDDPFCYTIAGCKDVADFELGVVKAQRRRLKFQKTAHLQDEIGDVLRISHPYSGETVDVYVTNLKRTIRFGENAAMIDEIEGWRLI